MIFNIWNTLLYFAWYMAFLAFVSNSITMHYPYNFVISHFCILKFSSTVIGNLLNLQQMKQKPTNLFKIYSLWSSFLIVSVIFAAYDSVGNTAGDLNIIPYTIIQIFPAEIIPETTIIN